MMTDEEKAERDALRAAALGDVGEPTIIVYKHRDGVERKYEVRAPTLEQQRYFERACTDAKTGKLDNVKASVLALIACAYIPGTENKLFEKANEAELLGKTASPKSLVGKMLKAVGELMSPKAEEVEKNSESTPSDDSSSS